jgi:hypothetical protein
LALAAILGCSPKEPIVTYTTRKPEVVDPTLVATPVKAVPQQTLGAIVLVEDAGWFFKVTGDPSAVEAKREEFLAFVKQVSFSAGSRPQPSWDLPEGWTEQPGDDFRFATVLMPSGNQPLGISVSTLPLREDVTREQFVLVNVNRWRGQVSLPELTQEELAPTLETFKVGEHDAKFVSLVGESAGGGMGSGPIAPFAGGTTAPVTSAPVATAPAGGPAESTARATSSSSKVTYDTPEGWTAGPTTQFRQAAFTVADGDKKVEITVIPLPSGSGTLLQNVDRWRGMVGLEATTDADLAKTAKKIETLGVTGDYVELAGPEGTILGVVVPVKDQIWYIKLQGDSDLAKRENARFQEFVKSLRLK